MADGVVDNIFLVNAPAGSGKTTWIRQQVESYLIQNPKDKILCITYTNRAAEELGRDLDNNHVYFGTIHSFINDFISSFFSHSAIIDLYWELYNKQIAERIENVAQNSNWSNTNERYKEKYGSVDLETIRSNIKVVTYNETPFNSLYRGALSHDDLISFTRVAVDRFPVIKKKIADKYQMIYIDEYQDTAADVLHIFYSAVQGRRSKLFLLGDKMQQIYKNYNGEFEDEFISFNKSINLTTNYRTTPKIVGILNAIYNDDTLNQHPYEKNTDDSMTFLPKVVITSDPERTVSEFRQQFSNAIVLYLTNTMRFHNIGVGGLFDAYSKMEKYQFGRKYSAVDVLTKEEARSNDTLLTLLFIIEQLIRSYKQKNYGEVLRIIRKQPIYLNNAKYAIRNHTDKTVLKTLLEKLSLAYDNNKMTILQFLDVCMKEEFVRENIYSDIMEDSDFQLVKDVCINEVSLLSEYLRDPTVSTQHGVKGESHDTVLFVADNSSRTPIVHMSEFLRLWAHMDIKLAEFDSFYYAFRNMIQTVENIIGMKCSDLKVDTYNGVAKTLDEFLQCFAETFKDNPYFIHLIKPKIDIYYGKKNLINMKNCLKEGMVYGPLCAYRLFYVGCSRSRKNLAIIINKKDIFGFETDLYNKLEKIGFKIEQQE